MHRKIARRPRRLAALIALAACGGGTADRSPLPVVVVAAQPCATPNRAHGVGVVVADGIVATAAHTVEGDLRGLRVDEHPATVLAYDARSDLALLAVPALDARPIDLSDGQFATAVVLAPGVEQRVEITSTGPLSVHDTTAGVRHRRLVHQFTPSVPPGTSGAPLVDEGGRLLGIVVLSEPADDVSYAATTEELAAVLAARPTEFPTPSDCPG